MLTAAPDEKLAPVMVTLVPPPVGPELGDMDVMVGPDDGGGAPPDLGRIVLSFFVGPGGLLK